MVRWPWSRKRPDLSPVRGGEVMQPRAFSGQAVVTDWSGDKFPGGFGDTQLFSLDYWELRQRSAQLYRENLYARGLLRRLITNEINTGLTPEACPDEELIGLPEDSLQDWTETTENRFGVWSKNPTVCCYHHRHTFGAIQRAARLEAYIEGDVLVVLRQSAAYRMPMIQLISGSLVRTPLGGADNLRDGHTIKHGVEMDAKGRVVAHWVTQNDGKSKRLLAYGSRSGRRISWLVYGCDKRHHEIRGEPILSLVLQSLKEIDRYRDSTQRKAVVNSLVAMFIKKGEDKPGTLPISGGATRKDRISAPSADSESREFNVTKQLPGIVPEELQHGEEPVLLGGQGTDERFGEFEEAIIQAVAWANEVPPEILRLSFSSNYSASAAAVSEFRLYLNKIWSAWGETFCSPIYVEWLISETLLGKTQAPGLLSAWRDPKQYDVFGAWIAADWYGSIKLSIDILKQAKGSEKLVENAWSTNAREARITTGTKFSKNIKRLKRENELKVEAARPLAEFHAEFKVNETDNTSIKAMASLEDSILELVENQ